MPKKKTTVKKKASPKKRVNKKQEIEKALAATPNKLPKQISEELKARGINVSPGYVSSTKTSLKAAAKDPEKTTKKKVTPKRKATKAKRIAKKKVARKKATKKQVPEADSASGITYEQLCVAKEFAQQFGGIEKAQETLAALSELGSD